MVLLLDVGNTAVTYGSYGGGRFKTSGSCLYSDIPKLIKKCLRSGDESVKSIVISSVVPKITDKVRALTPKNTPLLIAGKNLTVPVKHRYTPQQVGIDRLVNIYGALRIYQAPFLMLDYGTAITADYVSAKGVFEGGMIIPGPQVAFQALTDKAAQLPKNLRLPKKAASFLGTNTYDCMASGILQAYGAMADGLVQRFKQRFGAGLKVIATGGFASQLKPYASGFDVLDPLHSIKSLLLLYKSRPR